MKGKGNDLKLVADCSTRWNTVLAMLKRFKEMWTQLCIVCDNLNDSDWGELDSIIDILTPLEDLTNDLQKSNANAETAVNVMNYLSLLATTVQFMREPIQDVVHKGLSRNDIAIALLHQRGRFFEYMENLTRSQSSPISGKIYMRSYI